MGSLTLNGSTSGQITLNPPAVAGTNTLTIPAATDTLVGRATTDTLTNKTIGGAGVGLAGSTSGTITLQAAAVAGTNTVTIAAQTGTIYPAGPAVSAYASATQTVTLNTATKIAIDTEEFDTNNNFDTTTNRFTPTVAGYYQVNGILRASVATTFTVCTVQIYKNGANYKSVNISATLGAASANTIPISAIIYMNGTTDYLELWGSVNGTGTATFVATSSVFCSSFSAVLVRGA